MELIPIRTDKNENSPENEEDQLRQEDYTELARLLDIEEIDRLKSYIKKGNLPASPDESVSNIVWAATEELERGTEVTKDLRNKIGDDRLKKLESYTLIAELANKPDDLGDTFREIFTWIEAIRVAKEKGFRGYR